MTKKRLMQIVLLMIRQFKDPYYQGFAAQMAFYFILSIVPIMIVLSQILGLVSISLNVLDDLVTQYVSEEVAELLENFLTYVPTGKMNIAFIIVALWSASKAQFAMMRMANYTMTEGQSTGKGFFRDRLRALRTITFTLFTVAFALIILVYGELIFKLLVSTVINTPGAEYEIHRLWLNLRWPVSLALYFFMVSYNYYALSYVKVKFKEVMPGSIFASVGMLVVTFFYSAYTKYVGNFDIIYGSLASSVALMFWFFFLAWTLGLGVVFNKVYADTRVI
ncbi:MAG: YihY/virulence factor BrkB family protein [Clostridiales bacterium]|nr:YihY/virulence factor BrkB family protein [Clostridiales bacterium]